MKPKLEPKPNTDNKNQIESEFKRTRRELENTKNALKHQVARCRHLVSAFSKKLAEKDIELKHCKETREKQLSAVIRALLVLESRLRREQKSIRIMLSERDDVIKSQREEIARLEAGHDPDWASKLAARDAVIAARDDEIARLRLLCHPSSDSSDETESGRKSVLDHSGRLSSFDEADNKDDMSTLNNQSIFEKSSEIDIKNVQTIGLEYGSNGRNDLQSLLLERDALIKSQQEEIERLRSMTICDVKIDSKELGFTKEEENEDEETPNVECYAKPDLISSLCIDGQDEKESSTESVTEAACQPDSLSSDAASTRACLGDNDAESLCNCTITPPVVRGGLSVHDRSAFSPVPRSSHKYESDSATLFNNSVPDISKSDYSNRFESSNQQEANCSTFYSPNIRPSPSSTRLSMRSFDINYQDNPVLQCVNQILLKDPDDILEDQRSNKPHFPSIESPFVEVDDADQPFWLTNSVEEETTDNCSTQTLEDSPKPAIATSSPMEKTNIIPDSHSHPPKSSKLSLSKLIELHNAAKKLFPSRREHDGRKSVSMSDLSSAVLTHRSNPPVPPKPRKSSSKKVEFSAESKSANNSFQSSKSVLPPQPVYIDRTKLDIISKPSPLPFGSNQCAESDQDNDLYVISNSALDDEILQKLKGKNLKSFEIKLHRLAGEAMMQQQARRQHCSAPDGKLHPSHKPALNKAMLNNINLLEAAAMLRQLREASDPRRTADGKSSMSPSMSQKARLRVAASVAQLLAQAQQQAREQHLRNQAEGHIKAQMEHLKLQSELKNPSCSQPKAYSDQHQQKIHELQMKAQAEILRAQAEQHLKAQAEIHKKSKEQKPSASPDQQPSTSNQPPSMAPPPPPLPTQPPPPLSPRESPNHSHIDQRLDTVDTESQCTEESPSIDDSTISSSDSKDGDASTSSNSEKSPGTYDNFLEATGLSQKSIMTPSRMLNNHRSVVKPKDVKLRNKVRNAAIFERAIPPQVVGPTIKYWTEPYL